MLEAIYNFQEILAKHVKILLIKLILIFYKQLKSINLPLSNNYGFLTWSHIYKTLKILDAIQYEPKTLTLCYISTNNTWILATKKLQNQTRKMK
jgi:hypothetical protein